MNRKHLSEGLIISVLLGVCHMVLASPTRPSNRVIQAAYFHLTAPATGEVYIAKLAAHGFNTALVADGAFQIDLARWQQWGELAERYNLDLFAVSNFAVPPELRTDLTGFRPYVNRAGKIYLKTPCPLDQTYWERVINERFAALASFAVTTPIAGLLFDTEMYGSDLSLYSDLCYCGFCWQGFLASQAALRTTGVVIPPMLPKETRFEYLHTHKLLNAYTRFQWARVIQILTAIRERGHNLQPTLQFGFIGYVHNWFYLALVQGLGTPTHPALVFSESSYVYGYTPYVDRERDYATGNRQQHARYIPGLWLSRFFPNDLPSQLTAFATHTDGYWIYTADSLWSDNSQPHSRSLHGRNVEYWTNLRLANNTLRELAHTPERAVNPPRSVAPSSFYNEKQQHLLRPSGLQTVLAARPPTETAIPSDSTIYRGSTLVHCLSSEGGKMRLQHVPLGKDTNPELVRSAEGLAQPISYQVFDAQGTLISTGEVTEKTTQTINSVENPGDIFSLLVNAGVNGVQIASVGLRCVFEASSTFPLGMFAANTSYAIYVPAGQTLLKIRAHCPPQEGAVIRVQSPDRGIVKQTDIHWFSEFQLFTTPSPHPTFWTLTPLPPPSGQYGDLRFSLYDAEFPYVFPSAR